MALRLIAEWKRVAERAPHTDAGAKLRGVEFYASNATAPVWISSSNSQCGVLLLWTRER